MPITILHPVIVFIYVLQTDFDFNMDICLFYRIGIEPERLYIISDQIKSWELYKSVGSCRK